MARKIDYNIRYDTSTGGILYLTECPHRSGIMVGSDECFRCRYFSALTFKQQVECMNNEKGVSEGFGGLSHSQPYNLSPKRKEPVQTKIQW